MTLLEALNQDPTYITQDTETYNVKKDSHKNEEDKHRKDRDNVRR